MPLIHGSAPAVRPDRPARWFHALDRPQPGDQLPVGEPRGRFARNGPRSTTVLRVELLQASFQVLANGARPEDHDVLVRRQAPGDLGDEPLEVLEALWLARGLGAAAPAMAKCRVMPDVTGRSMMCRHVREQALEVCLAILPARDDGLPRIDPDERRWARHVMPPCEGSIRNPRHDLAHAGPAPASLARSA